MDLSVVLLTTLLHYFYARGEKEKEKERERD
jgi:hypothetical protein